MPLFGKPGFVTISFRHNSHLCEPITSIILDRAASRRSADPMLTLQILAADRAFIYTVGGLTCQFSIAHTYGQKRSSQ
jgi:hypothetical protein